MKKILVILGHPDAESFNQALYSNYINHLDTSKAEVKTIEVGKIDFNPNLQFAYRKRTELEPDLLESQAKIKWADHIVLIFPLWWGSMPALLKGFFDRVLLPGFAFKKRENSVWWDKYLTGKTARMIVTMDQPPLYFRFVFKRPVYYAVKKMTFQFIGVKRVKYLGIGAIRNSTAKQRTTWLAKMEKAAKKDSQ